MGHKSARKARSLRAAGGFLEVHKRTGDAVFWKISINFVLFFFNAERVNLLLLGWNSPIQPEP